MKIEVATQLRALLAQVETIIAAELAAASPVGVVTDPPTGVTDSDKVEWRANGYALRSDSIGLFRIKRNDAMIAAWPDWLRLEMLTRFIDYTAWNGGIFATPAAQWNAWMNMSNRKSVGGASAGFGDVQMSLDAADFHPALASGEYVRDYNVSPMTQAQRNFTSGGTDVLVRYDAGGKPNGGGAGAYNWDESIGADFWIELNRTHARKVCEARGADPAQFGL